MADYHYTVILDSAPVRGKAILDGQIRERDAGRAADQRDDPVIPSTIDDRTAGARANDPQADSNGEVFFVSRRRHHDGIARRSKRNGMPNRLAGTRRCHAVVAVTPACAIDVPGRDGKSIGSQGKKER
jgi:hypothetical protein